MLTSDLVRVRLYKKEVRPVYVSDRDPEILDIAASLIEAFAGHEGSPRHELEDDLAEIVGTDTDFLLHRALAKLLFDRCDFEAAAVKPSDELRQVLFDTAAAAYRRPLQDDEGPFVFDRQAVLTAAAQSLDIETRELESGLYADLKSEQVMTGWKPCSPDWLVRRYNVALAQGVLLRATELEIELGAAGSDGSSAAAHRELFRKIKFFQLMHRVKSHGDGFKITLDGPISLFKSSGKYGLQMASFLPTLLHFRDWSLKASLQWGPKRRACVFKLDPEAGLRSHTRLTGQWQPEELSFLPEQFAKLESDWKISTDGDLVNLGGEGVLVPDFVFTRRGRGGKKVYMEVLGFWRKGAVEARLKLLRKHGPKNLLLAISSALATGREELDELPGEVYVFRYQPVARKVLNALAAFE